MIAVGVILALLVIDVAEIVLARARLAAAADAVALAAAPITFAHFGGDGNPTDEAAELAAANGVDLIECVCVVDRSWSPRQVVVVVADTVELSVLGNRRLTAMAAAEFEPVSLADP